VIDVTFFFFLSAPKIKGSGENGILYLAEPIDACSPLENKVVGGSKPPFALIIRGRCSFDDKIRSAQSAGFKAAIIYDCVDGAPLIESNIFSPPCTLFSTIFYIYEISLAFYPLPHLFYYDAFD